MRIFKKKNTQNQTVESTFFKINIKRRLWFSAASFGYSVDKIVLDRKVVGGSPKKKTPATAKVPVVTVGGDNIESQSESLTEAKASASSTRHVEPLSYDQSLDLSGFLLSDSRQRKKETNNERSSETTGIELHDLLATLPDCLQTKENDVENPTVVYSRDSDSSLDDTENDLNAKSLEPSVATGKLMLWSSVLM